MSERTNLEIAISVIAAVAGALGIRDWIQKSITATVGPMIAPVVEDKRAELMERLRKLGNERAGNLLERLTHPSHGYLQGRLAVLLAKVKEDDTLAWFNAMDDDTFYSRIDILYNNAVMEWVKDARLKDGKIIAEDWEKLKHIVSEIFHGLGSGAKDIARAIDDAAEKFVPTLSRFADWAEALEKRKKGIV